jgi:hypothetical protein
MLSISGMPYDVALAQQTCLDYMTSNAFPQFVIHAPNGDTIAAATLDTTTMQYSDMPENPGFINCGARWHSPTVPRLATYTVDYGKETRVVNLQDAVKEIDFRGN